MMKKTAIALGLAMVSGLGIAAQNGSGASAQVDAGQGGASINAEAAINTQFDALDTNGDGRLSRAEAQSSSRVSALYDSMDTAGTIEDRAEQSATDGITRDQFQAGMQAAASGSGSIGPAVSGGETYTMMRDGSRKLKEDAAGAASRAGDGARNATSAIKGQVGNTANQAGAEAQSQKQRVQGQSQAIQNRTRDGLGEGRTQAEILRDRAQQKAATTQQRARGQADTGDTAQGVNAQGSVESNTSLERSGSSAAGAEANTRIDAN